MGAVADHCQGAPVSKGVSPCTKGGHTVVLLSSQDFQCTACGDKDMDFYYFDRKPCFGNGWKTAGMSNHTWQHSGGNVDPDCSRCGITASSSQTPVPPCGGATAPVTNATSAQAACAHPSVSLVWGNGRYWKKCSHCGQSV